MSSPCPTLGSLGRPQLDVTLITSLDLLRVRAILLRLCLSLAPSFVCPQRLGGQGFGCVCDAEAMVSSIGRVNPRIIQTPSLWQSGLRHSHHLRFVGSDECLPSISA